MNVGCMCLNPLVDNDCWKMEKGRKERVTNCFKKIKITVLDWPGNSPDINPVEILWSNVKNRLKNKD